MVDFATLSPMLLDERPLSLDEPGWIYELKYNGYRILAEFGHGDCRLKTRKGADASKWFPEVCATLSAIADGPYITDGEVCVLDELGRSDFDALQDRARRRRWYSDAKLVAYCVFDLLVDRGIDITGKPLAERKAALDRIFKVPLPNLLKVGYFEENARQLFDQAVLPLKLEGLVAKRLTSIYTPGIRSGDWVKVKRKGAIPAERFKRS
jgi:bifunctional non-homologous end joining protein LigD